MKDGAWNRYMAVNHICATKCDICLTGICAGFYLLGDCFLLFPRWASHNSPTTGNLIPGIGDIYSRAMARIYDISKVSDFEIIIQPAMP